MKTFLLSMLVGVLSIFPGCKKSGMKGLPKSKAEITVVSKARIEKYSQQESQNSSAENILHESVLFERFY